jgi:plastocyanin
MACFRTCVSLLVLAAVFLSCSEAGEDSPTPTPVLPIEGALTVHAGEWWFDPAVIALPLGEPVRIELVNDGEVLHDLKIDDLDAEDVASEGTGPLSAAEGELFVGAESGEAGTLVFTPREAGTFAFYCTIQPHRSLGMEGTLVVEPAPQ